jgi:hypothetical protein
MNTKKTCMDEKKVTSIQVFDLTDLKILSIMSNSTDRRTEKPSPNAS